MISGYSNVVCLSLFIYWHVSWLPTSVEASAEHGLTIYWPNISFWLYQSTSKMDSTNIDWMNQWEVSVMLSIQSSCYAIFYCVCKSFTKYLRQFIPVCSLWSIDAFGLEFANTVWYYTFCVSISMWEVFDKSNPLHPKVSIHILCTVLSAFFKVLTRKICLTFKSIFSRWSFLLFS